MHTLCTGTCTRSVHAIELVLGQMNVRLRRDFPGNPRFRSDDFRSDDCTPMPRDVNKQEVAYGCHFALQRHPPFATRSDRVRVSSSCRTTHSES